jgi:hypothetical protein
MTADRNPSDGAERHMADEDRVEGSLGFELAPRAAFDPEDGPPESAPDDDGAYEDSWYQVLKAKAAGSEGS